MRGTGLAVSTVRTSLVAVFHAQAACARGPVVVEEAPEPVVCRHGPECDAKWRRAREWVGMHSRWLIREDTDALIATDGPDDTRDPAFVIRRVASGTSAGTDVIVFGAGCTDRVRAFVDHVPPRGGRWRNVTGRREVHRVHTPGRRAGGELRRLR